MMMNKSHSLAFILAMIGALNWGLVGIFNWNLVDSIFGMGSTIGRIIYILVGLSAVYLIFTHKNSCKMCDDKGMNNGQM